MFEIEVQGKARNQLVILEDSLRDLRKPLRETVLFLERDAKLQIVKEQDPDGKPFAPLKPSTKRQKKTTAILRETSRMVNSIESRSGRLTGVVRVPTEYAIYHQTGTKFMKPRRILGISQTRHIPVITEIFEKHITP